MKKSLSLLFAVAMVLLSLNSCKNEKQERINPAFREYIQAFTAGPVSVADPVRIRLNQDFVDETVVGNEVKDELISFSPSIRGKLIWADTRTLEFRPEKKLPQGKMFKATFYLSRLLTVPDSLSEFRFSFRTIKQDFEVMIENHKAYSASDLTKEKLYGRVLTADATDDASLEKLLAATQDGKKLPVSWIHDQKNKKHFFQVDSIIRGNEKSTVKISADGDPIEAKRTISLSSDVFPLGTFSFTGARVIQGDEKYILVQFSDPLDATQNLNGLVTINRKSELRYSVDDNELKIYPQDIKSKEISLAVEGSVKNTNGKTLSSPVNERIKFTDIRPAVRFQGEGTIMPVSGKIMLPFEAVNLKAVDLKIIKIYENNILQFLQVNDLGGQSELARVGRVVLKKTIPLKEITDYSRWNSFAIDLSELIQPEEGALYCIRLNIRKNYSVYPCGGDAAASSVDMIINNDMDKEESGSWYYFGSYDDYYNDYEDEDYDWSNRDNPCKGSYYSSKSVSKNVLASNLGIIAKSGDRGDVMVVVTDLLTAKPVKGAKIEFYNLQQQKIGSVTSDGNGVAITPLEQKPFVVVVRKDKQTGYLKMQDGKSLSLSMFDAGGEQVQKGVKGFLYGDRGVWRPGDSLYLTFILDDKKNMIPENHPVTFTLMNPAGQVMTKITRNASVNRFYSFNTATSPDAPTGNWTAAVKIGNAEFRKTLKIETVKPNRLRINLDFGTDKLVKGKEIKGRIKSSWLTGATASNMKTTVTLTLTDAGTSFPKFSDFTFLNPSREFSSEKMTVFDGKLDENGNASFTPGIKMTSMAPGILRASFETTVYEEGGDFSIDRMSIPYYPFTSFAGLHLSGEGPERNWMYTGRDNRIDLVNVDQNGNLIKTGSLKVEIIKLYWRWWWDDSGENRSGFISTEYSPVTDSATVAIRDGRGSFIFNKDDEEWGRYFIRVTDKKSGHVCGKEVYVDWYGESHAPGGQKQAAAMLSFTSDKEKYHPGDKAKITIPSPDKGRALLTLENGSGVIDSYWFDTKKGNTEFVFDVTPDMAPNCYAYITLVQPHAQVANDLPLRLYGVIPIMVEDPGTKLSPKIIMKDVIRPEENVTITVKEEKGLPMTYTLAIVDEGLLDLTRFKTPDPWGTFNAREALGVRTWDLYDDVMGAFSGEFNSILSIGGDKDALNKGALKANRFKPVVRFFGPYNLAGKGSKTTTFKMPPYVGSVRVMVVAGNNGAYGNAEKAVAVRKPLMVLGTLPRTLSPGETVSVPVTVFAMEKGIKDVTVKISPNELFTINGPASKNITFSGTGEKIVYFSLKVKENTGIGKVSLTAVSGKETSENRIELDVRNPNIAVTGYSEAVIKPGETWTGSYTLPGTAGTNSGSVELYSLMPLNLEKRLGYLLDYPHGCLEQITSAAFPQLFLKELMDLSENNTKEIEKNILAAIQKIRSNQLANGGLSLWPGSSYVDDWATSYAGHFLLEAQLRGYNIPAGMLSAWKNFQKQKAISWNYNENWYNNDLMQAYRLYTLALAGSPEAGAMNRLMERKDLSPAARWRLAAAYQITGKPEASLRLISGTSVKIRAYESDITYGSETRDKAMIVETLLLMNRKNDAFALVKEVAAKLSGGEWMSTQTTAFSLLAVSKYTGGAKGKGINVSVRINNEKEKNVSTSKAVSSLRMNIGKGTGKGSVTIKNTGDAVITAVIITKGIPPVGDNVSPIASNLNLSVEFRDGKGLPLDPASIAQGTTFYAEINVFNPGTRGIYRNLALTQVMPSGWEIINARMSDFAAASAEANFTYQDVRDDRVMTYFDLAPGKSKKFRIMLNASYQGRFFMPAVYCEAMYDNSINARSSGMWTAVTERGK